MAHGTKYRIAYHRIGGGITTIDIMQRNYSSSITNLFGGSSPFSSSWNGDKENIYKPTIGGGARINIVANPLQLLELYSGDPQEWMVKVWNGASGSTLKWQGFINAEVYTEGYSNPIASEITLQCNDGMAILEKIKYKDSNIYYSGKETIGEIINTILSKLEITFNTAYVSNDLKVTPTHTNLFQYLDLFNENFIDESDNTMSCREVLESIIGGLGLVMYFEGDSIYFVDPINLHDTSKGKSYAVSSWGSESAYSLGGYIDISSKQITWGAVGSNLDIVPQVNEGVVKYNPYNFSEHSYNFADSINWNNEGSFTSMGGYQLNASIDYKGWTVDSASSMQIAIRDSDYTEPQYCLRLSDTGGDASYTHPSMVTSQDNNLRLKVSMQVYIQTKEDNLNIFDNGTLHDINLLKIPIAIKVGNQYWKGGINWDSGLTGKWRDLWVYGSEWPTDYQSATINDKWVHAEISAPLFPTYEGTLLQGAIQIEFLDNLTGQFTDQILPADKPFFLKDTSPVTCAWNGSSITWTPQSYNQFLVTITGFKSWAGIPATHILNDAAINSITTSLGSGTLVSGTYHDSSHNPTNFSSLVSQTTFGSPLYTASTDTLTFIVSTSGSYFGGDYNHMDYGNIYNLVFNYDYIAVICLIKDFKVEVIDQATLQQIGNRVVEDKAVLSTNLTGKGETVINTTSGTGSFGCSKGAFKSSVISPAGGNITGLLRGSGANYYTTSQLLLQSFMSQYKTPRFNLSGKLNVQGQPLNLRTKLIKDSNYMGSRAFYMIGGTYEDIEEMLDVDLIEITNVREDLEINV